MSGYSLIELLLATSLLIIVSGFAASHYQDAFQVAKAGVVLKQLQEDIHFSQLHALRKREVVGLCAADSRKRCIRDWGRARMVFYDERQAGLPVVSEAQFIRQRQYEIAGILYMRAFPRIREYVRFMPNGDCDNATFWYCIGTHVRWVLTLSRHGEVSIAYPNTGGLVKDSRGRALVCSI